MSAKRIAISSALPEVTPDIFTSGTAIVGIRGSGKTNSAVVLAEQAIAIGVPIAVVDPTGVWYGLKSSADGKSAGLPVYVFGGVHGDVPLEADAGAIVARFIVENRVPIILDLSDLSKTKQRRFVGQFCEALFDLKARSRDPLLVIVDEAARFCPQLTRGNDPDLSKCIGAVEDILALGRSRGLGGVIIGQRPATINKNVLTQADNLIAMRTVGAQDRKAIDEWVSEAQGDQKQRDELVQNMPALKTGEGFFWSPALFDVFRRVQFAARTTFDSSRTPKVGEKRIEPKAFATVDLDALRGEIAAAVDRAKADDPKMLRRRIAELEAAMLIQPPAAPSERVEVPILDEVMLINLQQNIDDAKKHFAEASDAIAMLRLDVDRNAALLDRIVRAAAKHGIAPGDPSHGEVQDDRKAVVPAAREYRVAPRAVAASSPPAVSRSQPSGSAGDVSGKGPQAILAALASTREGRTTRTQLAFLAGYGVAGGSYARYLTTLRAAGSIVDVDHAIAITAEGRNQLRSSVSAPASTHDVLAMFRKKLGGGPGKMFDVLARTWPHGFTRDELAQKSGYEASGGSFARYLTTLSSAQLIERRDGMIRLVDALFPTGRI